MQQNYKLRLKIIKNSNKELDFIYNTFLSITNRANQSFLQGFIKQNNYNLILEDIENLFNKYYSIKKPISLSEKVLFNSSVIIFI